jgi:DNA-binding transcriptional ArsR family regulator
MKIDIECVEGKWAAPAVRAAFPRPIFQLPACRRGIILNHMVQRLQKLDAAFSALSDRTRRGILERLGNGEATISGLAESFGMSLTGMKKHMSVLEDAGLVTTEKIGRVRYCRLGSNRLDSETEWIEKYRRMLEARLDSLGRYLERTKGAQP